MSKLYVINGPNLNRLGSREPEIYGHTTLADIEAKMRKTWTGPLDFAQSQYEGAMIEKLEQADRDGVGLILNAAAYTHTSIAVHDCLRAIKIPKIEVHLSNPDAREDFRKVNYVRAVVDGHICGFGWVGYILAIQAITHIIAENNEGKEGKEHG